MITRVTIDYLDGRLLASGGTFSSSRHVWPWVAQTIAHHFDLEESEIDCDDHDNVTINGVPMFRIHKHDRVVRARSLAAAG